MKINRCLRCDQDWCFRGTGRATRCGKCKSPYWDRVDEVGGDGSMAERRTASPEVVSSNPTPRSNIEAEVDRIVNGPPGASKPIGLIPNPEYPMCPYREYDEQSGETYACGLRVHPGKVKHTRGEVV